MSNRPHPERDAEIARRRAIIVARKKHWKRTRRFTGALLLLWFATTFLTVFFARELDQLSLFGWPLSFYMAAQGASLVYLAVIGVYALRMRGIDREIA